MIFAFDGYLVTPYKPLSGMLAKNDAILDKCAQHPERFMVSPRSGDPRVLVARLLTSPDNAAWEVWRSDAFVGILCLDRIVPNIDARWTFVFFDDELASKAPLLNEFAQRCFAEFGLQRLTIEAPTHMAVLLSFAKRKLGFSFENGSIMSQREEAYHDGIQWRNVATMRRFAEP